MTMNDGSGTAPRPEPATAGSYGEPPRRSWRLPEGTRLGPVRLQVAEMERSLRFYQEALGLRVVEQSEGSASLAAIGDDRVLVQLRERPGALPAGRPARLGLYHFAILLPDRPSLGRVVRHLAAMGVPVGAGDHLVSEAIYLQDPDGLGIELYADRPRSSWRRIGRELMLATDPVDMAGLIAAGGDEPWGGMPAGTVVGHVHLHVGDLQRAADFFSDLLGFDRITWSYPGALFLGAGGYHHHLGTNSWAGPGALPAGEGDARLLAWTIELPDAEAVAGVERSLTDAGHPVQRVEDGIRTADPWGTGIRIRTARVSQPRG